MNVLGRKPESHIEIETDEPVSYRMAIFIVAQPVHRVNAGILILAFFYEQRVSFNTTVWGKAR